MIRRWRRRKLPCRESLSQCQARTKVLNQPLRKRTCERMLAWRGLELLRVRMLVVTMVCCKTLNLVNLSSQRTKMFNRMLLVKLRMIMIACTVTRRRSADKWTTHSTWVRNWTQWGTRSLENHKTDFRLNSTQLHFQINYKKLNHQYFNDVFAQCGSQFPFSRFLIY